jgi:DNA-binding NarL/FixJ family response regulator
VITGLRVVVVDDHPMFRHGLRTLLEDLDVDVVAEAADGEDGVAEVLRHRPDVVLMDLQMPRMTGIEACARLARDAPDVHVLVLTMVAEDGALFAALKAGARGYLLKGAGREEIARTLAAVAAGQAVLDAEVVARLHAFFAAGGESAQPFPGLSDRERDVLALMAAGAGNADIARRLFLSDKTVRNYVSVIFSKLGVQTRAEAIVRAREAGLGG